MPQHARIEEVSDSDLESDPSEQDLDDFAPAIIRPSSISPPAKPSPFLQPQFRGPSSPSTSDTDRHKRYQCLYPLYFDANRTRSQGRRVGQVLAVPNPLAREIVDAVQLLGLDTVFEPGKTHPKDWSNPGRVRVLVKDGGRVRNRGVSNKHHLYTLVSKYLLTHPTTRDSPLRLRIQGIPRPETPLTAPDIPRGWKMNTILPLHSPALSGGGVSENIIKDVMQEIQAGQAAGLGVGSSSSVDGVEGAAQGRRKREGGKKR